MVIRFLPSVDGATDAVCRGRGDDECGQENNLAYIPTVTRKPVSGRIHGMSLLPRFGPRPLVATGMLLGAIGMFLLSLWTWAPATSAPSWCR